MARCYGIVSPDNILVAIHVSEKVLRGRVAGHAFPDRVVLDDEQAARWAVEAATRGWRVAQFEITEVKNDQRNHERRIMQELIEEELNVGKHRGTDRRDYGNRRRRNRGGRAGPAG